MEKTEKLKWKHEYYKDGDCFLEIWVDENSVCIEDGPAHDTARNHQGIGGSQSISEFITKPLSAIDVFPGLHKEICEALKAEGLI